MNKPDFEFSKTVSPKTPQDMMGVFTASSPAHKQNLALQYYRSGDYEQSLDLLKKLLKKNKGNPELLNLAGVNHLARGEVDRARLYFKKALSFNPKYTEALNNLGNCHNAEANYDKAMPYYRKVAALDPNHASAINNILVTALRQKDCQAAEVYIPQLVQLAKGDGDAFYNIGRVYAELSQPRRAVIALLQARKFGCEIEVLFAHLGQQLLMLGRYAFAKIVVREGLRLYPESVDVKKVASFVFQALGDTAETDALNSSLIEEDKLDAETLNKMAVLRFEESHFDKAHELFDQALALDPYSFETYLNKGIALRKEKKYAEAIGSLEQALSINKFYFEAYAQLGYVLVDMERYDQALQYYTIAEKMNPSCVITKNNIANVYHQKGDINEAIVHYQRLIDNHPDHYNAYNNLSVIYRQQGNNEKARDILEDLRHRAPNMIECLLNLSNVYTDLDDLDQAIEVLEKVVELSPKFVNAKGKMMHLLHHMNDFDGLKQRSLEITEDELMDRDAAAPSPFELLPLVDVKKQQLVARKFTQTMYSVSDPITMPFSNKNGTEGRVKIGYFSSDFYNHATMHLMRKVFEHHDRNRYEIYVYCLNEVNERDPYTKYLMDNVDHFYPVKFIADREIAKLARSHGIDIAIDLKGYTKDCRTKIFAYRAAPIQMNYLGYPGTMGAEFMDYIIADDVVIPPEHHQYYDEKVVSMPSCYQVNDLNKPVSDKVTQRADWGLPEDAVVLACFNNNYKITERELSIWMRVLKAVDHAVLWMFEGNRFSKKNILAFAEQHGVDESRIIFAPKIILREHLERHRHIDLFLDTFGYNAHTTASDALWSGVPLVTLEGNTFCGRVASSILQSMGMDDLVTHSEWEYEAKILELACSAEARQSLKNKLTPDQRSSFDLFNAEKFTRDLEGVYSRVVNDQLKGYRSG